jgi:nanoRNase/pAp phosphatase (c-di-AMP/oligoRNAs hydrolase)
MKMKDPKLLSKIITRLRSGSGLILLHHNADVDAIGSAIALNCAFPSYPIGVFNNISQLGKKFLQNFKNVQIIFSPELNVFDSIIILDTSSPAQLGVTEDLIKDPIVLDHHTNNEFWKNALYYCDETKSSCAEIIFELLEKNKNKITTEIAQALLGAILADTGHFKYANIDTLIAFSRLMELGNLSMSEILALLENKDSIEKSQRIAHLKGAQRMKFREEFGYLIATSLLSSYEASMCKQLLHLGADAAFVGAQRDFEVRISGRVSGSLVNRGVHLGRFFQELGLEVSCEGGGHAGAGGLNGSGDTEMILNLCLEKLRGELKSIAKLDK